MSRRVQGVHRCQVAIIGAGIAGLSTAYHLKRAGVDSVIVLADPDRPSTSARAAGFTFGALFDNVTRIAHAYGLDSAARICRFSQQAHQSLVAFCEQHHINVKLAPHLRLLVSANEVRESQKAVVLFQQAGIPARCIINDGKRLLPCNPEAVPALQNDGLGGGYLDAELLCQRLHKLSAVASLSAAVTQLCWQPDHSCVLHCGEHKVQSELVVLACHHHMVKIIPELQEVVIPYSDQWSSYRAEGNLLATGLVLTANHGHEWGVVVSESEIRLGGARFLRRLAGTGDAVPRAENKISAYLQQRFLKFLPVVKALHCQRTVPLIGVRPCDELPLIGPLYGNERVLLATGFMGNGLSWGFLAGKCLAELICHGHSAALPRQLWPERLRTLPS